MNHLAGTNQLLKKTPLYSEKLNEQDYTYSESSALLFKDINLPALTHEQKELCDQEMIGSEILKSLKNLKPGKTPGIDRLLPELYKFFWIDMKDVLIKIFEYPMSSGELAIEQKRGIITLIFQKSKNSLLLKNWRLIYIY